MREFVITTQDLFGNGGDSFFPKEVYAGGSLLYCAAYIKKKQKTTKLNIKKTFLFKQQMTMFYKVIEMYCNPDSSYDTFVFELEVAKWLNVGWTPVGGVCRSC